ncbi:MAG: heme ABC transporter ATP-binding protein [Thermoproteota archaeon]|nr:MAG: heme ABC transporter ATP-binding protein [Candidatus Korarchaeota archaeon]
MPAASMRNVTKRYGSILACDRVDFTLEEGEVHALLGENGAGKTTLMSILYGLVKPDEGEIWIWDRRAKLRSPRDAMKLGIGMVHQFFTLVDSLTVAENLALAAGGGLLSYRRDAEKLLRELGATLDPSAYVWQLSAGEKQQLEILKALARGARILILDEPTSVLTESEARWLFKFIQELKSKGASIVFVTHKLDEALAVSDRITVMRKGRVVGSARSCEVSKRELAEMMVGREPPKARRGRRRIGGTVLEVRELAVRGDRGELAVSGVSFEVRAGEVFGIAGVSGNGQRELAEALAGLRRPEGGEVLLAGRDVTRAGVGERRRLGLAYIPEDRLKAVALDLSVAENLVLTCYSSFCRSLTIDYRAVGEHARKLVGEYGIVASSIRAPVKSLSGGNVQKLVVARELASRPKLLVAAYPTSGLDVAAAAQVRGRISSAAAQGAGVVLISEDVDELLEVSDRVAVMVKGRFTGVLDACDASRERIGILMGGSVEA